MSGDLVGQRVRGRRRAGVCPGSSLVLQMYDRAISAPTSPTRLSHSGKRSWEEPNWMGSPRLLNKDMKTGLSRSLQTLPTDSAAFDTGERLLQLSGPALHLDMGRHFSARNVRQLVLRAQSFSFLGLGLLWTEQAWAELTCLSLLPWQIHSAHPGPNHWPGGAR